MWLMAVVPPIRYVHIAMELWGVIFCLIAALSAFLGHSIEKNKKRLMLALQLLTSLMLLADAYAWMYRGVATQTGYYMVRISNFAVYVINYTTLSVFTMLLSKYLTEDQRRRSRIRRGLIYALSAVMITLMIVSQFKNIFYFFDVRNYYHRNEQWFWITQVAGIAGILIGLSIILQFQKSFSRMARIGFLSYPLLPVAALIIQISFYGISLLSMAITISMLLMYVVSIIEQNHNSIRQEHELADMKIAVMLSQIRPHFIFNTLTTIRYLIRKKPDEAVEAIDEFSKYLRANLESLSSDVLIPFTKELEHVKNYVAIEKRRFGERINVLYDIDEEGFVIPGLTLQPLVENAIKHGITQKKEGGTVIIRTGRREGGYTVLVIDDGVGFEIGADYAADSSRQHIGINNVKSRLKNACGGTLKIESTPGCGTSAEIFIPERGA